MNGFRMVLVGGVVGTMLAGSAWAQQRQPGQQPERVRPADSQQAGQLCLSSKIVGMSVKAQQEQFGRVADLLINSQGQVQYLVIDAQAQGQTRIPREKPAPREREGEREQPGAAARGELIVVPWETVKVHEGATEAQTYVMINLEKERLMQAPKFSHQQLSQKQQQQQLSAQVDKFFNIERRGVARPEIDDERNPQRPRLPQNPNPREDN